MSLDNLPTEETPWRIEVDGWSLPYWFEDNKLIIQGFVQNDAVVPTPRPELYIIRIPCTANIIVKMSQDGPEDGSVIDPSTNS